jgi:DNA invertase Pin-like site-specific DNA recombinase
MMERLQAAFSDEVVSPLLVVQIVVFQFSAPEADTRKSGYPIPNSHAIDQVSVSALPVLLPVVAICPQAPTASILRRAVGCRVQYQMIVAVRQKGIGSLDHRSLPLLALTDGSRYCSKGNVFEREQTAMRVGLYLRVSTDEQTLSNQRRELRQVARQRGWRIVQTYEDQGVSGSKGRDKRPGFDQLLRDATSGKFDLIAAWSVDRLGRSLSDLVAFLSELQAVGVDLYLHKQGLDTSTPAGRAMFQMSGVFAEFELAMIRERTRAGMARARAQGKRIGRPPIPATIRRRVLAAKGSNRSVAELCGISEMSVRRIRAGDQRFPPRKIIGSMLR